MIAQEKKTREFQIKRRRSKKRNLKVFLRRLELSRQIMQDLAR